MRLPRCRNFAPQRDIAYPAWFLGLLEQLGVDPAKEADAYECGLIESGQLMYGGWFVFVGELLVAGENVEVRPEAPDFTMFFSRKLPQRFRPVLNGEPLLAAEFTTHLDWVLAEPRE